MAYTPNYTAEDLPNIFTDFIGKIFVDSKVYIPLFLVVGVLLFLSGAVTGVVATWRRM